ncbi:hypothetical protein M3Y96_00310400 [Aphelenchoides besseyi]|nr:hypothetical protein M3Y96_00310400 [Aphelenchoides besseyi]
MTYVATATSTSIATAVSVNNQHRKWLKRLNKLDLKSGHLPDVWTDVFGYENWLLSLLKRMERTAGWESLKDNREVCLQLQRFVIQPLKIDGRIEYIQPWPGIILQGDADPEPILRSMATEFNGNIARVDVRDLMNRRFYFHGPPVKGLLQLAKKKLRPLILVMDSSDLILNVADDPLTKKEKVLKLKSELCAFWPSPEDRVCVILTTRLLDSEIDRKFIGVRFRILRLETSQELNQLYSAPRTLLPNSRTSTEV